MRDKTHNAQIVKCQTVETTHAREWDAYNLRKDCDYHRELGLQPLAHSTNRVYRNSCSRNFHKVEAV